MWLRRCCQSCLPSLQQRQLLGRRRRCGQEGTTRISPTLIANFLTGFRTIALWLLNFWLGPYETAVSRRFLIVIATTRKLQQNETFLHRTESENHHQLAFDPQWPHVSGSFWRFELPASTLQR